MNRIESEIRGAGLLGSHASQEYRALEAGQPLILVREPTNRADTNAVIAKTLYSVPCGYIARQHAAMIAPEMDAGTVWLAKVIAGGGPMRWAKVLLWKEQPMGTRAALKARRRMEAYGADERTIQGILAGRYNTEDRE